MGVRGLLCGDMCAERSDPRVRSDPRGEMAETETLDPELVMETCEAPIFLASSNIMAFRASGDITPREEASDALPMDPLLFFLLSIAPKAPNPRGDFASFSFRGDCVGGASTPVVLGE